MARRITRIAVSAAFTGAFALGIVALFAPAQAASARCLCPQIYAPVRCSNGKTYPNACVADCHHATGCVPTGDI